MFVLEVCMFVVLMAVLTIQQGGRVYTLLIKIGHTLFTFHRIRSCEMKR